jgi:uncharacterized RDD family membrane protein YckC
MMLSILKEEPDGTEAGEREGAGFGIRALARAIDAVVHLLVGTAVGVFVVVLVAISGALRGDGAETELARLSVNTPLGYVAALLGSLAMHTLAEGIHGSTLGKRLCGLTVVGIDGGHADLLAALKRSVAILWDAFFFGLVAFRKMSESPRRQRYGDAWANTQVVRIRGLDPAQRRSFGRFFVAVAAALTLDGVLMFIEAAFRLA